MDISSNGQEHSFSARESGFDSPYVLQPLRISSSDTMSRLTSLYSNPTYNNSRYRITISQTVRFIEYTLSNGNVESNYFILYLSLNPHKREHLKFDNFQLAYSPGNLKKIK